MDIIHIDNLGIKRRAIMNESIILVNGEGQAIFDLIDPIIDLRCKIIFNFEKEGEDFNATIDIIDGDVHIKLFKWDDELPIENRNPVQVTTNGGLKLEIKFRSSARPKYNHRTLEVSVWLLL